MRRGVMRVNLALICLLGAMAVAHCRKEPDQILTIPCAAVMAPFLQTLAEEFMQQEPNAIRITIASTESDKALEMLMKGTCAVAASSSKMTAALWHESQKKKGMLREYVTARDVIVAVVHPSNGVRNLFIGQLADMYTGLIKDWKETEGTPARIEAVDRNEDSELRKILYERFFQATKSAARVIRRTDNEVVAYVAAHPASIGYVSMSCRPSGVRILTINGFSPTEMNIDKGYYPLWRELYLYVDEAALGTKGKQFVAFILGPRGEEAARRHGFMPRPASLSGPAR